MSETATLTPIATAIAHRESPPSDFERLLHQPVSFSPREILEGDSLDKMMRIAEQLANSKLSVPKHLVGNIGDCLAIVTQAMLWNMNPFAVAQKTHIVNGALGYEAQLVNAVLQNSGAVRGLPHYEYRGDGKALECRVGFIPRGETEICWNEWLCIGSVTTQNSPLWKTNPKQQLGYLQIKNWARAFAPGAILGVYTVDELEDSLRGDPPSATTMMGVEIAPPMAAGRAPAPVTERPPYPAENFEKNRAEWNQLIQGGKKSAQQVIDNLLKKATLTDDQVKTIRAMETLQEPPEAERNAPADDAAPADDQAPQG